MCLSHTLGEEGRGRMSVSPRTHRTMDCSSATQPSAWTTIASSTSTRPAAGSHSCGQREESCWVSRSGERGCLCWKLRKAAFQTEIFFIHDTDDRPRDFFLRNRSSTARLSLGCGDITQLCRSSNLHRLKEKKARNNHSNMRARNCTRTQRLLIHKLAVLHTRSLTTTTIFKPGGWKETCLRVTAPTPEATTGSSQP